MAGLVVVVLVWLDCLDCAGYGLAGGLASKLVIAGLADLLAGWLVVALVFVRWKILENVWWWFFGFLWLVAWKWDLLGK